MVIDSWHSKTIGTDPRANGHSARCVARRVVAASMLPPTPVWREGWVWGGEGVKGVVTSSSSPPQTPN